MANRKPVYFSRSDIVFGQIPNVKIKGRYLHSLMIDGHLYRSDVQWALAKKLITLSDYYALLESLEYGDPRFVRIENRER